MVKMIFSWGKNFFESIKSPNGWRLLIKIFVLIIAIWGAFNTLITYQTERIEKSLERAEISYYNFINNFGHDSERIRMGAISNILNIMLKKLPSKAKINFFDSVKLLCGINLKQESIYHLEIKRLLYHYIRNMGPSNTNWAQNEMELIINILIDLGYEGWFEAEPKKNNNMKREDGIKWLWQPHAFIENDIPMANLFIGVKLDKVNFKKFDLTNADFRKASLVECQLKYSKLINVIMNDANLIEANLEFSRIANAQFNNCTMIRTKLLNSFIENSAFKLANLEFCDFTDSIINNSYFQNANINNADFFESKLEIIDFSDAIMNSTDFSDVRFNIVKFHSSILDNSKFCSSILNEVNFRLASLENADFSKCEIKKKVNFEVAFLKGANFSESKGIEMVQSWMDANISNVIGLSDQQIDYLIGKGAVVIPSERSWQAYKAAGRPHSKWKEYSESK